MTRLIDGDELTVSAYKKFVGDSNNPTLGNSLYKVFEELISNAPTVEYTFEEAFTQTVCEHCTKTPADLKESMAKMLVDAYNSGVADGFRQGQQSGNSQVTVCSGCEDKAAQYSLGFQDGFLTAKRIGEGGSSNDK